MPAMVPYRIEVGERDGVKPANIVGAIANEAGLDGQYIRRIDIHDDHTTLELPDGMPRDIERMLKKAWVCGKQLRIRSLEPKEKRVKKRVFKAPPDGKKPGKRAAKKPRKKK
jgi:ATP-dependent RNA helicase DeaD